jgi:siroheme synthase (precorrin-2 oxidase/ferrochelatase)
MIQRRQDVQHEFVFRFLSDENKNAFKSIAKNQNIFVISAKEEVFAMPLFRNRKAELNFEIEHILIAIITGGSLTAIIRSLRDVIIEYIKKSKVDLTIERGANKIKIEYNNKTTLEEIVNEKLIKELFISKEESENQ